MSRSYKKYPGWTGRGRMCWYFKRIANHRVRKNFEIPSGGSFKKGYETWMIRDYNFRYYSRREAIEKLSKYYKGKIYHSWMK